MLSSMTGFGRSEHSDSEAAWTWEIRSVNARGLELRWRLPPGLEGLESSLRETVGARLRRGSIQATLTLRLAAAAVPAVNEAALEQALQVALRLAARVGGDIPRVETLMGLPGVMGQAKGADAADMGEPLLSELRAGFAEAADRLVAARRGEGGRLGLVLEQFVRQLSGLRDDAAAAAAAQPRLHRDRLMASVIALLGALPALPEERIAQEVALLASRSDVREEVDRLGSHIEALTGLLASDGTVGRQLDFLVQELIRETNTICSKSSTRELTAIGLQLKGVVEQVREQVQNIE